MRKVAKLFLAVALTVGLSGCSFLDNIICSLFPDDSCDSGGDIEGQPPGQPDPRVQPATHVGEARRPG